MDYDPGTWTGDEWERYATLLLHMRHPAGDLQETPSEYRGDLGLDGFSRTHGHAYQCYASTTVDHKRLHENQQQKIREDTQKLIDRANDVALVLGSTKLVRWTLLVPNFTSTRLLQYCSKRAAEINAAGLPFINDGFTIGVERRSAFASEEAALGTSRVRLNLPDGCVSTDQMAEFAETSPSFLARLREKLSPHIDLDADKVHELVRQYLNGQNIEEHLRAFAPLYEQYQSAKQRREASLAGLSHVLSRSGTGRLRDVRAELDSDIAASLPSLLPDQRDLLRDATIVEWLGRCPLRLE